MRVFKPRANEPLHGWEWAVGLLVTPWIIIIRRWWVEKGAHGQLWIVFFSALVLNAAVSSLWREVFNK